MTSHSIIAEDEWERRRLDKFKCQKKKRKENKQTNKKKKTLVSLLDLECTKIIYSFYHWKGEHYHGIQRRVGTNLRKCGVDVGN